MGCNEQPFYKRQNSVWPVKWCLRRSCEPDSEFQGAHWESWDLEKERKDIKKGNFFFFAQIDPSDLINGFPKAWWTAVMGFRFSLSLLADRMLISFFWKLPRNCRRASAKALSSGLSDETGAMEGINPSTTHWSFRMDSRAGASFKWCSLSS